MICNNVDMYTLGDVPMNGRAWGSSLPGHLVPRSFNHSPPPPPLPSSRWGWQGNWSGLMGPIEGCQQGSGGDGSLHTTLDQSINLRVHLQCVGLCLFVCLVYACVKGGPTKIPWWCVMCICLCNVLRRGGLLHNFDPQPIICSSASFILDSV